MKLEVTPSDGSPKFEVEITKETRGINNYYIAGKQYRAFQYDCYDRPKNYEKQYAQTKSFHGFLIGRGKNESLECYVKIKY